MFLITLISATPPQASQAEFGLDLRTGVADHLKINTAYDFHVHVFNSSNGYPIYEETSCYLHLYTLDGHHQYEEIDTVVSHDFDYGWDVDAGNFTEIGEYEYIIQCNNSLAGGFVAGSFEVNELGNPEPDANLLIFLMILGLFNFFFILYTLFITLRDLAAIEVTIKTVSLAIAAYFSNMAYYYFLFMFAPVGLMLDISYLGLYSFGLTHLFIPFIGLLFSYFKGIRTE